MSVYKGGAASYLPQYKLEIRERNFYSSSMYCHLSNNTLYSSIEFPDQGANIQTHASERCFVINRLKRWDRTK